MYIIECEYTIRTRRMSECPNTPFPQVAAPAPGRRITLRLCSRNSVHTMSFTISATAARVVASPAFATKVSKVRIRCVRVVRDEWWDDEDAKMP